MAVTSPAGGVQVDARTRRTPRVTTARWSSRLTPLLVPLVLLVIWQASTYVIPDVAMATPAATLRAFVDGMGEGWLSHNLWVTFQVVLQAFALSAGLGLLTAMWLGTQRFWGEVLEPPLVWACALPKITVFPVFLLVFGLGDGSRIAFGAFHGFFPLVIFVLSGIRAVPPVYSKVARSLNLGRVQTMRRVVLPATLPSVLAGLRFCVSLCFLGVVLAEMFGSKEGAGYELIRRITIQDVPEVFAIALSLMAIAFAVNLFMLAVESRLGGPPGKRAKHSQERTGV